MSWATDSARSIANRQRSTNQLSQDEMDVIYPQQSTFEGLARSAGQGATLYFGDEIEAAIKTALGSDKSYRENVTEIREKISDFSQRNPGVAITSELVGAIVPSLLTGGATAGTQATRLGRYANLAGVGAVESGLAAIGASDASIFDQPGQVATAAGLGAGTGLIVSPVIGVIGDAVVNIARSIGGGGSANKVKAELQRLVEATGKTPEEVVEDVANGRIVAENKTLEAATKVYVSKAGGGEGAKARKVVEERAERTKKTAEETIRRGLAPQTDPAENVLMRFKRDEAELAALERQAYREAFPRGTIVDEDLMLLVEDAANRAPAVVRELNELSRASGMPPLFVRNKETKFFERTRPLEIMDVERARRVVRDQAVKLKRDGRNELGNSLSDLQYEIQTPFFARYDGSDGGPNIQSVINKASRMRRQSEAFDEGRKALGKGFEDVQVLVDDMTRMRPDELPAFRAGFLSNVRNTISKQEAPIAQFASESRLGPKLRAVFPEANMGDLMRDLETARGAESLNKYLQGGSSTNPMALANQQIGSGAVSIGANLIRGDLPGTAAASVGALQNLVKEISPDLNPDQMAQVLRVLVSEDPDVVRKALDPTQLQSLRARIAQIPFIGSRMPSAAGVGNYIRQRGTVQGTGQATAAVTNSEYQNQ